LIFDTSELRELGREISEEYVKVFKPFKVLTARDSNPGIPNPRIPGIFLNPEIPGLGGSNPGISGLEISYISISRPTCNHFSFHSVVLVYSAVACRHCRLAAIS
jgi:hypothetical protein